MRALLVYHMLENKEAFVDFVGVDPSFRRCAYAKQLLEHILHPVQLIVADNNYSARGLYMRNGFMSVPNGVYSPGIGESIWRRSRRGLATPDHISHVQWNEMTPRDRHRACILVHRCHFPLGVLMLQDCNVRVLFVDE